ncbi:hypothetical protein DID88_001987 [Monilinia fructigena]|uniref:Uncharacterized protein n=1 Tax=Monilinia fructigena TaxID=38457 RepID=A0A395IW84_9HELO|nr:hypothetical protein DID88_001987 [Monilinia fructigena]
MSYSLVFDDAPQLLNLFSEWLCFSILWAGIKIYSFISREKILHIRRSDVEEESTSLAFFIVTSGVCASIVQVDWILPFLTPALYFVTRHNSVGHYVLPSSVIFKRSEYPANYGYHLIFYILIAISTSVIFLPSSTNPVTIGLALIFLICQTAIYSRLSSSPTNDEFQPSHQLFQHLEETCCWVVCFLTLILLVSQQEAPELPSFLIYSTFKALLWIAVVFLPSSPSFPLPPFSSASESPNQIEVVSDMTNGLFPATRCATNGNPIQNVPEMPKKFWMSHPN